MMIELVFTTKRNAKKRTAFILIFFIVFSYNSLFAQENYIPTYADSLCLENVIVETYHVSDSSDLADTTGGILPIGSVTYRIFIDMKPGYNLQLVYGDPKHDLYLKTSTLFFNNMDCFAFTGFNVDAKKISENSVPFDSWITLGAATRLHTGILKEDDTDGSLINKTGFEKADGLTKGVMPNFQVFNLDEMKKFYVDKNVSLFSTNNGGWAALGGVQGPTSENRVLIAQVTTDGKLTFKLNIQIGTSTGGSVKFVADSADESELVFNKLTCN